MKIMIKIKNNDQNNDENVAKPLLGAPCRSPTTPRAEAAARRDSSCSWRKLTWDQVTKRGVFCRVSYVTVSHIRDTILICYLSLVAIIYDQLEFGKLDVLQDHYRVLQVQKRGIRIFLKFDNIGSI